MSSCAHCLGGSLFEAAVPELSESLTYLRKQCWLFTEERPSLVLSHHPMTFPSLSKLVCF